MARARRRRNAAKAKPKTGASTHMRPMVRAATATTRAATRRPAKRAPRFAGTWPAPPGFVFPKGAGGFFSSVAKAGRKGGFRGSRKKRRTAAQKASIRKLVALNRARRGRGKAAARRPSGKRKGRTAAQRAATKRMIAANRARGGTKARPAAAARRKRQGYPAISGKATYSGAARAPKGFRSRRAAASRRRKAGHKNLSAIRHIRKGQRVAGLVRRNNPRGRGGSIMARQNPRRRRRRNPGMDLMGTAKRTIAAAIPAVAGGAIISLIDAKLLADRPQAVRIGGKVVAAALASVLLRSRPDTAKILMGAILGSLGYELGTKLSGGLVTPNKAATVQALGTLIREDPAALGALIDSTGAYSSGVPNLQGFESVADVNLG